MRLVLNRVAVMAQQCTAGATCVMIGFIKTTFILLLIYYNKIMPKKQGD